MNYLKAKTVEFHCLINYEKSRLIIDQSIVSHHVPKKHTNYVKCFVIVITVNSKVTLYHGKF